MTMEHNKAKIRPVVQGEKLRGADKVARLTVKITPTSAATRLPKPKWIRAVFPGGSEVQRLKKILRDLNELPFL